MAKLGRRFIERKTYKKTTYLLTMVDLVALVKIVLMNEVGYRALGGTSCKSSGGGPSSRGSLW